MDHLRVFQGELHGGTTRNKQYTISDTCHNRKHIAIESERTKDDLCLTAQEGRSPFLSRLLIRWTSSSGTKQPPEYVVKRTMITRYRLFDHFSLYFIPFLAVSLSHDVFAELNRKKGKAGRSKKIYRITDITVDRKKNQRSTIPVRGVIV